MHLLNLGHAQVQELSAKTRTPFTTLWKIRSGETDNPRLETVRAIWPELSGASDGRTQQHGSPPRPAQAQAGAQEVQHG